MSTPVAICVILGFALLCRAHEPRSPDSRHWDLMSVDGDKMQTLACGLTVPKIAGARGYPQQSVGIRRINPGDEDLSDALEMWRADQFVAAWRDPCTNTVTLLEMAYPFPKVYQSGQSVPANDYYRETRPYADAGYSRITQENIQDWMKSYYQGWMGTANGISVLFRQDVLQESFKFKLTQGDKERLVYVLHMRVDKKNAPDPDVCYVVEIRREREIAIEHEIFAEKFLGNISFDPGAHRTEREFWNTERESWIKGKIDCFVRANAVRGIANLTDEWRDFRYGDFALVTDNMDAFDSADEGLQYLQSVYNLFPTVLFPCGPTSDRSLCVIRLYATFWEFQDCLSKTRKWSGGHYQPGNNEILVGGWAHGLTVHEATHQYLHLATGRRGVSTWFNEGFACYFAGCKAVDNRLVGEPVNSGHLLVSMMKHYEVTPVSQVFTVKDFYEDKAMEINPKDEAAALRRAKNYTAAWGIIYFLREAAALYHGKGYETIIPLYWETLQRTGDDARATRIVLEKLPMSTFLSDFRDYFLSFEELYKKRERGKRSTDPKCDCEYCDFLRRTKQPYPSALSLYDETTAIAPRAEEPLRHESRSAISSTDIVPDPALTPPPDASNHKSVTRGKVATTVGALVFLVLLVTGVRYWGKGTLLLVFSVLLSADRLFGESSTVNGYTFAYRVADRKAEIFNGNMCAISPKPEKTLSIPETLGGYPVSAIGVGAFDRCPKLASVTIPSSVTAIGAYAFAECPTLASVSITGAVASIGDCAFFGCYKLETVTIPESVTSIGNGAFFQCSSLKTAAIPASVTTIGDFSFSRCFSLTSVTIGQLVSTIGSDAFSGCTSLTNMNIPTSTRSIGDRAFKWCSGLRAVTIPALVPAIGREVFAGCASLSSVTITRGVTTIGNGAFKWCSGLKTMMIPDSVTSIGDEAFYGCRNMASLRISDFVTKIGSYAFYGCHNLENVVIPYSVTTIGSHAFEECYGLNSVTIPHSVTTLADAAFSRCSGLFYVAIPDSVTTIEPKVFHECTGLTSVDIPASVSVIGDGAFEECGSLTSVSLPDSVTAIKDSAFANCSRLGKARIGDAVSTIGRRAFAGCSGLQDISMPRSVNHIGDRAFESCRRLTSVYFCGNAPSSVGKAVYDATPDNMTSYVMPDSKGWGSKIPGMWNERPVRHQVKHTGSEQP